MWPDSPFTHKFGVRFPIVQGPFGGGLSSPRLAATVSNAGGLGSYGAQGMTASRIADVISNIRAQTTAPFAINLWVSNDDPGALDVSAEQLATAAAPLAPFFEELGVTAPPRLNPWPRFDDQIEAIFDARPPIFSFIFGVPSAAILDQCRSLGIGIVGTATTVDEAIALADAGVDAIVASGFEAGGHRASFLRAAEASLTGTLALVPQVVDAVNVPVVAAGGIADGRGMAASFALGAAAVQIGTAFLACEESNASPAHRDALRSARARHTFLTRSFTGRLGRGLPNRLSDAIEAHTPLPYPVQGQLVGALREAALRQGRDDLVTFWSGQSAALIRDDRAEALFARLVSECSELIGGGT
jgi:nitronate monooxygenase